MHFGIIDFLAEPTEAVVRELRGLAAENSVEIAQSLDAVKYLKVDHIETTAELLAGSRYNRVQYYQQTMAAFFEALARADLDAGMKVVEIGADRTFHYLRVIQDLCDEAYALNIFFQVSVADAGLSWPIRVLGDMNSLPFQSAYFDLVMCSASLHHSSDLPAALAEIARVLKPGGRAITVNEPIAGVAKRFGGRGGHSRDKEIHEDPISFREWRHAIQCSGLRAEHFVPSWFTDQVRDASHLPAGTRFRWLARAVRPVARGSGLRDLGRTLGRVPSQWLLGLPLNAVLWKTPLPAQVESRTGLAISPGANPLVG